MAAKSALGLWWNLKHAKIPFQEILLLFYNAL